MTTVTVELLQAKNRKLTARIDELEEELRQAREMMIYSGNLPQWLSILTRKETEVLRMLLRRDVVTFEGVRYALYQGAARDEHLPYIWICKLRRKLTPIGIKIITRRAENGWSLEHESRLRIISDSFMPLDVPLSRRNMEIDDDSPRLDTRHHAHGNQFR